MKCPKCDRQNSPKSKFCGTCGSNLFIACSDCKTNNPAKLKFCGNCGSRLVKGKSVERTPVRPRAKVEETTTYPTVNTSDDDGTIRGILGGLFCLTLYFIPFGVALFRNKHNKLAIFVLNLLLGWTFLGWVLALIWATTARRETDSPGYRYMSSIQNRAKGGPGQGCLLVIVGLVVLGIIIAVASSVCGEDTSSTGYGYSSGDTLAPKATSTPNQGYSGESTVTRTPTPTVTGTPRAYATATRTRTRTATPTPTP